MPTPGPPEIPEGLSPVEQDMWRRLIWALEDMGTLHQVDGLAVEQYCRLHAETAAVARQQAETMATVALLEETLGHIDKAELVEAIAQVVVLRKLIAKFTSQLRAGRMAIRLYLAEFGLTPASRNRVRVPVKSKSEPVDEFTAFQRSRV